VTSLSLPDLPSGPIAPDPKDSYLLALAEASKAEFSRDRRQGASFPETPQIHAIITQPR